MSLNNYPPDSFTVGNSSTQILGNPAEDIVQDHQDSTAYSLGDQVKNGKLYYWATVGGTSGIGSAPTHLSGTAVDGAVTWKRLNRKRNQLTIQNDSDESVYLAFGNAAVINNGTRLNKNGGTFNAIRDRTSTPQGAVFAICASGGKNVTIQEY